MLYILVMEQQDPQLRVISRYQGIEAFTQLTQYTFTFKSYGTIHFKPCVSLEQYIFSHIIAELFLLEDI